MRRSTNRTRSIAAAVAVATLTVSTSGCSLKKHKASDVAPTPTASSSPSSSASATPTGTPTSAAPTGPLPTEESDPKLVALLPGAIVKSGTLNVGTDSTYAPSEFLGEDGKTVQGFDIDLFNAVAQKLGLKANYVSAPFANIIPGVESGKYDVAVSSFTITAEREKAVEMVSYFSAGTQWAVKAGSTAVTSVDDACGKKVAVQTGTTEETELADRSAKCKSTGKAEITVDHYQGQDQATAAVVSGKDDAMSADSPVTAYAVQQTGGKLATLGPIYSTAPYGYVLKKTATDFAKAIASAVNAMIASGDYKKILEHWGLAGGAISKSEVDPKPITPSAAP